MYCIHCGAQNADASKFCLQCGQPLSAPPAQAVYSQPSALPPTPVAARRAGGRTRRWPILLAATLGFCIILAVGGYLLARQWLHWGSNQAAKVMPSGTAMMLSVSPSPTQLTQIQKLQAIAGLFGAMTESQGALPSNLLNVQLDLDLQKDIIPWAGLEMAAGVTSLSSRDAGLLVAVAMRDSGGARKFTDKLVAQLEKSGRRFSKETYNNVEIILQTSGAGTDQLAFAQVNGFLVAGAPPAAVRQAVDTAKGRGQALEKNATYQKAIKELAGKGIGYLFLDLAALERLGSGSASSAPIAGQALQAVGATLAVESDGIRMDFMLLQDPARLTSAQLKALQTSASANRVLGALPENAWLVASGQKLAAGYDQLFEVAQAAGEDGLEETISEIEQELGFSLERDLFAWADGEYALAFYEDPTGLLGQRDTPFNVAILLEARDRRAAERGMTNVLNAMADSFGSVTRSDATFSGVKFSTLADRSSNVTVGYGQVGEFMVFGTSTRILSAAADASRAPLAKDAVFKAATARLPSKTSGYIYVNVAQMADLIYRTMSTYEKQDFNQNVRPYIEDLRAIAVAGQPGGKDGITRGSAFLLFNEGAFK